MKSYEIQLQYSKEEILQLIFQGVSTETLLLPEMLGEKREGSPRVPPCTFPLCEQVQCLPGLPPLP